MIFYATKAGLTVSDFGEMTVGAIEDVIIAYGDFIQGVTGKNDSSNQRSGTTRNATQADFDRFSNMF